jgi:hypothetical protein
MCSRQHPVFPFLCEFGMKPCIQNTRFLFPPRNDMYYPDIIFLQRKLYKQYSRQNIFSPVSWVPRNSCRYTSCCNVFFLFSAIRFIRINSLDKLGLRRIPLTSPDAFCSWSTLIALWPYVVVGANKKLYGNPLFPSVAHLGDAHNGQCGCSTSWLLGLV